MRDMTDTDTIQHTDEARLNDRLRARLDAELDARLRVRLDARYEAQMRLLQAIHAEIQPQQAARNELFAN